MTSGGLIILLVISLQWYLLSNNTPKELKTIKTHLFSSNFAFTTTFHVFVAVVIYCLSKCFLFCYILHHVLGIFFTLSLFLNCNGTWYVSNGLKFWNTISEGNGWNRGSSISIVVNYGEKQTVFENLINSVRCHYNCRQKQVINYFKSFHTGKNIYIGDHKIFVKMHRNCWPNFILQG